MDRKEELEHIIWSLSRDLEFQITTNYRDLSLLDVTVLTPIELVNNGDLKQALKSLEIITGHLNYYLSEYDKYIP